MKLKKNQVFNNVSAIGELLGKEIPSKIPTNTKNSWLKEFSSYCEWHKEGRKFIVDKVYKKQREIVDNRKDNGKSVNSHGNNNKYAKYIDKLFENVILSNGGYILAPISQIIKEELKFVTNEFENHKYIKYNVLNKMYNTKGYDSKNYINSININLRNKTFESLTRLQKQGKIQFNQVFIVRTSAKDYVIDNEISMQLRQMILNCEEIVRKEKYDNKKVMSIVLSNKADEYYLDCLLKVQQELSDFNIIDYKRRIEIIAIDENCLTKLTHEEEVECREKFLHLFIDKIHDIIYHKKSEYNGVTYYPYQRTKEDNNTMMAVVNMDNKIFNYDFIKYEDDGYMHEVRFLLSISLDDFAFGDSITTDSEEVFQMECDEYLPY